MFLHVTYAFMSKSTFYNQRRIQGGAGTRAIPIPYSLVFFCNHFEELQTVLFGVELIINKAPPTSTVVKNLTVL